MKKFYNNTKMLLGVLLLLTLCTVNNSAIFAAEPEVVQANNPIPVIIDTDFASDCDDILAVRMALVYQELGIIDLKGIALSTCYSQSPKAVSALLQFDGAKQVPIGMDTVNPVHVHTNYVDVMGRFGGYGDYVEPVKMYRKILAESPEKVNIVTLGFMQNIANLIKSAPDEYSPLTGMELVQQKVENLYVLGGTLSGRPSFNFYWTGEYVVNSAKYVNDNYPGNIIYMPTELGGDVWNQNQGRDGKDIVSTAMYSNHQKGGIVAWDTMGIYGMVNHMMGTMEQNQLYLCNGWMYISDNGSTVWNNDENYPNRQIMMKTADGLYYSKETDKVIGQKFRK